MIFLTSKEAKLGIDLEKKSPRNLKALSKEYFTAKENKIFAGCHFSNDIFYQLWTIKEALAKAESNSIMNILNVDCSCCLSNESTTLLLGEVPYNYHIWQFQDFTCALITDQIIDDFSCIYIYQFSSTNVNRFLKS